MILFQITTNRHISQYLLPESDQKVALAMLSMSYKPTPRSGIHHLYKVVSIIHSHATIQCSPKFLNRSLSGNLY